MYQRILTLSPREFLAHYRMGLIYIKNNLRDSGIESLKQAQTIDPYNIDTLVKLGELLLREEN